MAGEMFNQRAGVDILHVPYKGGSPALVDVVGGRVGAYYSTPSSAAPHIATGKVIALATTGLERTADMPDIPTIAESGFRSEEHTSELQSLMRISYAVFCLKQNKNLPTTLYTLQ